MRVAQQGPCSDSLTGGVSTVQSIVHTRPYTLHTIVYYHASGTAAAGVAAPSSGPLVAAGASATNAPDVQARESVWKGGGSDR